jgi:uroporphyrinogen decarboxylase
MRQAGRYMEEYRALRAKYSMLDLIQTPELAAEVTMQPINAFDLDAAIIFADILPPLIGMGLNLEFVPGKGPVIYNPIDRPEAITKLQTPPAEETLYSTIAAVKLACDELTPRGIPLIGFAGAPFTLASYAVEGGGSKDYTKTKALMYSHPKAWAELMEKLVVVQVDYLLQQAKAGASALQVFDSWVGLAVGKEAYNEFIVPYNMKLFQLLKPTGLPVINFSTGTFPFLEDVAACGGDVIGVDFRMPLGAAWKKVGYDRAVQGNLDPATLLVPWDSLRTHIDRVLDEADSRPGHIFNLGHGINKTTPVDAVKRMVDYIHDRTKTSQIGNNRVA